MFIGGRKNLWLFSSWMGKKISDNPYHFHLWMKSNHQEVRCIWIVSDKGLVDHSNNIYHRSSIKGIYYQLFAGVLIFSHSPFSDFNPLIVLLKKKFLKCQLWHGGTLKKIFHDVDTNFLARLKRYTFDRYDLVLSPGPEFNEIFEQAFRVNSEALITAKYPRILEKKDDENIILYAPTFRNGPNFDYFKGLDFFRLQEFLETANQRLLIRLHPTVQLSKYIRKKIERYDRIEVDMTDDVNQLLPAVSVLVSDYSSIIFDYLYYQRPIIFSPFDLNEYMENDRGFYFDYSDVNVKPVCHSWDEVLDALENIKLYDFARLAFLKTKFCSLDVSGSEAIYSRIQAQLNSLS